METIADTLPMALPLSSVDRSMINYVGGKAANLGDIISGGRVPVPDGFVVTAKAYRVFFNSGLTHISTKERLKLLMEKLESLDDTTDLNIIRDIGASIRETLYEVPIPLEVTKAILREWEHMESVHPISHDKDPLRVAVRSSATAEDLPHASFAGQHDTYLNIVGYGSVLNHIKSCWISLFTDRAIIYRIKQKFSHLQCYLCVVVQKQINSIVSGIMFTADAITGQRNITVIDAGFGLGEALVSGLINPDEYKYNTKTGVLLEKKIGDQEIELIPEYDEFDTSDIVGGTKTVVIEERRRKIQKLTNDEIDALVALGTVIEDHYNGAPQDIEWCIERMTGKLYIVQSRPITTLFPLPEDSKKNTEFKVYVSFGHIQGMMDPIRPCGRSVFKRIFPFGRNLKTKTSSVVMDAGCFIYLNGTRLLQVPILGKNYVSLVGKAHESLAASLKFIMKKEQFPSSQSSTVKNVTFLVDFFIFALPKLLVAFWAILITRSPERIVSSKTSLIDLYMTRMRSQLRSYAEPDKRLNDALKTLETLHKGFFQIMPYALAGFISMGLLRKIMGSRVDQAQLDAIERGLKGNVTTEMDLAIGDLSDVARKEPKVAAWLKNGQELTMDGLYQLNSEDTIKFRSSFRDFLDQYGCRANSEIDISKKRWRDDPSSIFQVIRGNLTNEEAGHHRKHHQQLVTAGDAAANYIIAAAPWHTRFLVRRLIRTARALMALREHPKFLLIQALDEVRQIILEISSILVSRGNLATEDDVWFLTADEIVECLDWEKEMLQNVVAQRKESHDISSKFRPPIVLTSEGECVNIHPHSELVPPGALPGLGVSSGVAEGIAKVVTDPTTVVLHSGEILVARCTDPGWTPLFINASAVVMEVGGYLTHGSVVSREYNLPAVTCIENATSILKTGMRLRVDGTNGYVEILLDDSLR